MTMQCRALRCLLVLVLGGLIWSLGVNAIVRAGWTDSTIAATWFGMFRAPALTASATCRNTGHEAVWVAETGTDFLDIIQVGSQDGDLFYAWGSGHPNGIGSVFTERHLGPAGTGPHRYGLTLAVRVWTLTIDGRTVARISDSFRTWRLRATQVMSEGTLPFNTASCSSPGRWHFGGYGPQPNRTIGPTWWTVT
ncbi:MAG: hypothetical protein ACYDAK_13010 [Candidatus Limnocylindrales bacterium]